MSEAAEAPAAEGGGKKKSKLPVILVLVLLLGGGGFFAMKMKGGAKKKPEVKMSKEKPVELKEFLVNLKDRGVYCRTEISLGVAEGVDAKGMEEKEAAIRDIINMRLSSKSLSDVSSVDGLKQLKRELAADLNKALDEKKPDEDKDKDKDKDKGDGDGDASADSKDEKDKTDEKDKADAKPKADEKAKDEKPTKPKHPDWDSDTGPILKIYFSSFATQ